MRRLVYYIEVAFLYAITALFMLALIAAATLMAWSMYEPGAR